MTQSSERAVPAELARAAEEQAALRRVATLVAGGATEAEIAAAVARELGDLFESQAASVLRWDGDTIRVIGDWRVGRSEMTAAGRVYAYGGDTITARVVESAAPGRVDSAADMRTDFGRRRWEELGYEASIGAPILVEGKVWGVVTASRTREGDTFPEGSEQQLGDFAALVAQAIVNAEARREAAALVAEQSALRQIATLVAGGKPHAEVLDAVLSEVGVLFAASTVMLVRRADLPDELLVVGAWSATNTAPDAGSLFHPRAGSATLRVLETGLAVRSDDGSPEQGVGSVIAAPVIVQAVLIGALTASRPVDDAFPAGAEVGLRSFANLAAQSIANERAQAELRASRARIVRAADETRERLERNLHDGAQQRFVSVSVALRMAAAKLPSSPDDARALISGASEELTLALEELRDLARGLHPAVLTTHGLEPALDSLASRVPVPVSVRNEIDGRLPHAVEAAVYYVVSESLANVAKYAHASEVTVHVACVDGIVRMEVADDGVGGAEVGAGSGLLGLADRIEALGGRFGVDSPREEGTRVWAEVDLDTAGDA